MTSTFTWSQRKLIMIRKKHIYVSSIVALQQSQCQRQSCQMFLPHRTQVARQFTTEPTWNKSSISQRDYCIKLVRKCDHENYLCSLLWSGLKQRASFAIRAFNVELAQVRDVVSDKQIGIMRLKFWHDNIEKIFQGFPPKTPVALELYEATQHFKLSKRWLTNMVTARSELMEDKAYRNLQHVEEYGEKAMSAVNYNLLQILDVQNIHADHAASHIGKTQGLVTLLRSTPYHASKHRVFLPLDLLIKHKVSQENIIRGSSEQNVKDVMYDIASLANQHLQHARSFSSNIPADASLAFLSTVSCEWYLTKLQQTDFNVFDPKLQNRNNLLPLQLWLTKRRKAY